MSFEFDPEKDAINIAKHGLSLADFEGFDDDPALVPDGRLDYGEDRIRAYGHISELPFCLVFTIRERGWRLISLRRAHRKEMKRYG